MYIVSKIQVHILYILGDMIPPSQGSSLSQDSSLNRKHEDNCYISGYKGQNEISRDVPQREQTLLFMVKFSDLDDETMTVAVHTTSLC